jgi:hypothetical protein
MFGLTTFGLLFFSWALVTLVLCFLLIRRGLIAMKEDDQIFLDPAEAQFESEQKTVVAKLDHIAPFVKGFGIASATLFLGMVGLVAYEVLAHYLVR